MKKNIIMVIITLVCGVSLLLVLYFFNTKDIYYVSDKVIDNNEITMQIKNGSTYTAITKLSNLNSAKYYRISSETNCSLGNASFYYSNNAKRLKIKVNTSPLKCKIVFEEIKGDLNIISLTLNNEEISTVPSTGVYSIDYVCTNIDGTPSEAKMTWNNSTHKLNTENITNKTFCTVNFYTEEYNVAWKKWAQYGGINPNNYSSLQDMMNDSTAASTIINAFEAYGYLLQTPALVTDIKALSNYESTLVPLFIKSNAFEDIYKLTYGLPVYLYNAGNSLVSLNGVKSITPQSVYAGIGMDWSKTYAYALGNSGNSNGISYNIMMSQNSIDLSKYSKYKAEMHTTYTDSSLSCEYRLGFYNEFQDNANFNGTYSPRNYSGIGGINNTYTFNESGNTPTGYQYFKLITYHWSGTGTCYAWPNKIYIY